MGVFALEGAPVVKLACESKRKMLAAATANMDLNQMSRMIFAVSTPFRQRPHVLDTRDSWEVSGWMRLQAVQAVWNRLGT